MSPRHPGRDGRAIGPWERCALRTTRAAEGSQRECRLCRTSYRFSPLTARESPSDSRCCSTGYHCTSMLYQDRAVSRMWLRVEGIDACSIAAAIVSPTDRASSDDARTAAPRWATICMYGVSRPAMTNPACKYSPTLFGAGILLSRLSPGLTKHAPTVARRCSSSIWPRGSSGSKATSDTLGDLATRRRISAAYGLSPTFVSTRHAVLGQYTRLSTSSATACVLLTLPVWMTIGRRCHAAGIKLPAVRRASSVDSFCARYGALSTVIGRRRKLARRSSQADRSADGVHTMVAARTVRRARQFRSRDAGDRRIPPNDGS